MFITDVFNGILFPNSDFSAASERSGKATPKAERMKFIRETYTQAKQKIELDKQAELPRASYGDPMGNNRFSDSWIEDGSYLRLKTVNISYQIPTPGSWTWLQGLTVWAEAQNLLTLTKYLGNDPEFSIASSVFYQGIDCGTLAQGRSFMAGVKINL